MSGKLKPDVIGATAESFPLFRCPSCKRTGEIDVDQMEGRVSIECPFDDCSYHETTDWEAKEFGAVL